MHLLFLDVTGALWYTARSAQNNRDETVNAEDFKILIGRTSVIMVLSLFFCSSANAYWMWSPETGTWTNPKWAVKSTPEEQFIWANSQFENKQYKKAAKEFRSLAVHYSFSEYAPEAQFMAGESYMQAGAYYKAYEAFQKLMEEFPSSARIDEAIDREIQIANYYFYNDDLSWKSFLPIIPVSDHYDVALEIYEQIIKNAPYGSFADDALYKIGDTKLKKGDYSGAMAAYERLIDTYPDSEFAEVASYKIALSVSKGLDPENAKKSPEKALENFEAFASEYPDSTLIAEAKNEILFLRNENAQKLYDIAVFYHKNKRYKAAEFYYDQIIQGYAETGVAKTAQGKLDALAPKLKE